LLQTLLSSSDDVQTVQLITQAGDDLNPPIGSLLAVVPFGRSWKVALGSYDGITPETMPGEREIYSSVDGIKKAKIRCTRAGKIAMQNDSESLYAILSDLISVIDGIKTELASHKHTIAAPGASTETGLTDVEYVVSSDSQTALNTIKTRISEFLIEV